MESDISTPFSSSLNCSLNSYIEVVPITMSEIFASFSGKICATQPIEINFAFLFKSLMRPISLNIFLSDFSRTAQEFTITISASSILEFW